MRDILFRGKRIDNGKWIEGCLLQTEDDDAYIVTSGLISDGNTPMQVAAYKVAPETVGQYVGEFGQNKEDVFEGDICRVKFHEKDDIEHIFQVSWKDEYKAFVLNNSPHVINFDEIYECKVVCSIFDTEEN